jgi:hypothetical protein
VRSARRAGNRAPSLIKCLDPEQRPVPGGLIKIGDERRVRAVEADRESP